MRRDRLGFAAIFFVAYSIWLLRRAIGAGFRRFMGW